MLDSFEAHRCAEILGFQKMAAQRLCLGLWFPNTGITKKHQRKQRDQKPDGCCCCRCAAAAVIAAVAAVAAAAVPLCRCAALPLCRCAVVPLCNCAAVPLCRCSGLPCAASHKPRTNQVARNRQFVVHLKIALSLKLSVLFLAGRNTSKT